MGTTSDHNNLGVGRGRSAGQRAFTMIEILIVVVILGILAAVVVPHFSNATSLTRENTLKDDVRYVKMQVAVFRAQHRDVPPGYPNGNAAAAPTEADFLAQMTQNSSELFTLSATATAVCKFGPYLEKMPANPISGKATILVVGNGQPLPAPTGAYGWIYKPQTGEFVPDLTGVDSDGKAYAQY